MPQNNITAVAERPTQRRTPVVKLLVGKRAPDFVGLGVVGALKLLAEFEARDRMTVRHDLLFTAGELFARVLPKRLEEPIARLDPVKIGDDQRLVYQR